jgi:hypothetical protein
MFGRLDASGFVDYTKHAGIRLTDRGMAIGRELAWRQCRRDVGSRAGHRYAEGRFTHAGYLGQPARSDSRVRNSVRGGEHRVIPSVVASCRYLYGLFGELRKRLMTDLTTGHHRDIQFRSG